MFLLLKLRITRLSIKVAMTAIFIAVGVILSWLNPFAYFYLFGTKINPFAHLINAITGVLIGLVFSCLTAIGIAFIRYSLNIGSIHAFHGGISGALVVGIVAYLLRKKMPKYVEFAALFEPIGTVFIGGTIAELIAPLGLFTYWWLFALSCIPGCIIGFAILLIIKKAGISWENQFE